MRHRVGFPRIVALGAGAFFLIAGLWALAIPEDFFDAAARFEPYNQHLIQDIGAFQIGIGAVLVLGVALGDGLAAALLGSGIGAGAHVVSHIIGRDLGGRPEADIPAFAVIGGLLFAAGIVQLRMQHNPAPHPDEADG